MEGREDVSFDLSSWEFEMRRDASYKYRAAPRGASKESPGTRTEQTNSGLHITEHKGFTPFWPSKGNHLHPSAAMRGHFSIEWMAQSSQPAGTEAAAGPGGTHAESLPGFYCRQKPEHLPELEERRSQSLDTFSQHQTSPRNQGEFNPPNALRLKNGSKHNIV